MRAPSGQPSQSGHEPRETAGHRYRLPLASGSAAGARPHLIPPTSFGETLLSADMPVRPVYVSPTRRAAIDETATFFAQQEDNGVMVRCLYD